MDEAGHLDLSKSKRPEKNSYRSAERFINRWGLKWNIPFSHYRYDRDTVIPYLSPRSIVAFLLDRCPHLLFGGCSSLPEARLHLKSFWECYRAYHPEHVIYEAHPDHLTSVIPMLWHGDEGRGIRKGNTTVCTIESPFGLDTYSKDCYRTCPCCKKSSEKSEIWEQQNINLKEHSFLTKFLLFALPKKIYKDNDIIPKLCKVISLELRSCFYEGIEVNGRLWHVACVGLKGDMMWFLKIAELDRSFTRLSEVVDKMCCHECLAGSEQHPFEDLQCYPRWRTTLYAQRPWLHPPSTGIMDIPFDKQKPEKILKRDVFHNTKIGVFQDFIGSAILLVAELSYFHLPGGGNSRKCLLDRMHMHFKLFCQAAKKSPHLMGFSKCFLNVPSRKHYGWARCKGSDSMILLEWLQHVAVSCLNTIKNEAHRSTLEAIHSGSKFAVVWTKSMYKHGLFWPRACAASLNKEARGFLRCYNYLAWVSLHRWKFPAFALKPKAHMVAHTLYEVQTMLDSSAKCVPSVLMFNCESNEDVVGRISRLSRRVHQSHVCERILEHYLTKCHALTKKFREKTRKRKMTS